MSTNTQKILKVVPIKEKFIASIKKALQKVKDSQERKISQRVKAVECENIYNQILLVRREIDNAKNIYDHIDDDDLIEANIYQQNSLNSQHEFLLKQAKEKEMVSWKK